MTFEGILIYIIENIGWGIAIFIIGTSVVVFGMIRILRGTEDTLQKIGVWRTWDDRYKTDF